MKSNILVFRDNDVKISTWDLAQEMGIEHRACKLLVKKYRPEFEELSLEGDYYDESLLQYECSVETEKSLSKNKRIKNHGGQIKEIWLNEPQAMYLLTLFQNNANVRKFKMGLTNLFFKQ